MNKILLLIVSVLVSSNIYTQSLKSVSNGIQVKSELDTIWGLTDEGLTTPDGRLVTPKQLGVTLESTARTIYVSEYTGDDNTGDGATMPTAFATFDKAISTIGTLLDATVTIQLDSGTYYCSVESIRDLLELKTNANVDIYPKGTIKSVATLTGLTQDATNPFKYNVTNTFTVDELKGMFVDNSFRIPIHSNGTDYLNVATAESTLGTSVTENKTTLIFNNSDHIVMNYLAEYSRGGIFFQDLIVRPLGNKALRLAAFGTSKFKFDGCVIEALNVQNNNVVINQCYLDNSQRGVVLNNYNSFIEQSVIIGPGKTSGKACFDIQNGNVVLDNMIIDGFGEAFENSQGIANITFYDNSSDLYILNCAKVFSANDGYYVGTGDLDLMVIDNVDYIYNTISDKNVHIVLDTATIEGTPAVAYVENDNGVRVSVENNYAAYINGVHDSSDFLIPNKGYIDSVASSTDTIETYMVRSIGTSDLQIQKDYGGNDYFIMGTGIDNDFDVKYLNTSTWDEYFGLGISKQGIGSTTTLYTTQLDANTNIDIDGHLLVESDDTLYIGSKTDNPAYFLKPTGVTEYTSWKSANTVDYIQLGGEGGQVNVYSPNLFLSSNNGGYVSVISDEITARGDFYSWQNKSNVTVASMNMASGTFNVDDCEAGNLNVTNKISFNGEVESSWYEETYAATVSIDFTDGNAPNRYMTITGDVTINVTLPYGTSMLKIYEDLTGAHTITTSTSWGTKWNTLNFDTSAEGATIIRFVKDITETVYFIDVNEN